MDKELIIKIIVILSFATILWVMATGGGWYYYYYTTMDRRRMEEKDSVGSISKTFDVYCIDRSPPGYVLH